jgi:site-specific DNA-cytosine methylase
MAVRKHRLWHNLTLATWHTEHRVATRFNGDIVIDKEIRHFHLFCGLGGGAKGFNAARPIAGLLRGRMRCLGGVDIDPAAIADFNRLADVQGTVLDLFDRQQYTDFHGHAPPTTWQEATPADIRRAAGNERPHIVFLSSPCKGLSGLLPERMSKTARYQALNRLTLRGMWLMLEAWDDDPPEFVIFENVPRIATRGRHLLDQINGLLCAYGYAVRETHHDCGQLGALAQSRKRFLLVARHQQKVAPLLYEPPQRGLLSVGSVLGRMPLPGDPRGGPMHKVPSLQWKTWLRLAFVEAGSDWRSLNKLAITESGTLRDYAVATCEWHDGVLGVRHWQETCGTVTGNARATTGAFSIADPRPLCSSEYQQYGVRRWDDHSGAVSGQSACGGGTYSVADPRVGTRPAVACFRIVPVDQGHDVPALRPPPDGKKPWAKYPVSDWVGSTGTVIGGDDCGAYAVADPRSLDRKAGDAYLSGGHYGVVPWTSNSGAICGAACHDNGAWSVADPRDFSDMPRPNDTMSCRILALDGTWHRPFTTLELAALQSLVEPEEALELDGLSDKAWRERIGNAVPPEAARAIADVMGQALLMAWSGEGFALTSVPIWVRPTAVALSVVASNCSSRVG